MKKEFKSRPPEGKRKPAVEMAEGAGIYFFIFLAGIILDYGARILIARSLGPDSYGLLNLAFGIFNIVAVIGLFGLPVGITRYVSYYAGTDDWSKVKSIIISGRRLVTGAGLTAAVLLILCSRMISGLFNEPYLKNLIIVFALSIPFFMLGIFYMSVLRGFRLVKDAILARELFNKGIRVFFIVVFIVLGKALLEISIAYFLGFAGFAVFSYIRFTKTEGKKNAPFKFHNVTRELVMYSWPLMFSLIFVQTQAKLDSVLLGYFRNAQEVGIYNAALPLSQIFIVLSQSFLFIFLPVVSSLYAKRKMEEISLLYKIGTRWISYFSGLIFLVIFLFSRPIIQLTFGAKYLQADGALKVLAVGFFFNSVLVLAGGLLDTIEKTRQHMIGDLLGLFTAVGLSLILIPNMGIIGTAVAMTAAILVQSLIRLGFVYRYLRFQPFEWAVAKFFIVSGIIAGGCYLGLNSYIENIPLLVFPAAILIVFLSVFIFIIMKGINKEELEVLSLLEERSGKRFPGLHRFLSRAAPRKE